MRIELPDDLAQALQAKAAAEGLDLQTWLGALVNTQSSSATLSPTEAAARIIELQRFVKPDPEGWTVLDYINHGRS